MANKNTFTQRKLHINIQIQDRNLKYGNVNLELVGTGVLRPLTTTNCCLLGQHILQLHAASETLVHMYHMVSYSRTQMTVTHIL
jgi:Na+-translocating ferredoxin:NAD+ oxidoreductase RnfA subunit